jgi:glycerol-3-phosphate dehydrogenase
MSRQAILQSIREVPNVTVLIAGGGVNGIGLYRDLALQGVDALLVDKADFCAGASSASSHMAHGGIRYLENGEFRLVREALRERNRLLYNAPHQVRPLPTTIPIYDHFSGILNAPRKFFRFGGKPGERGALVIKLGLMMYDGFTRGQRGVPKHNFYSREQSLAKRPNLNPHIVATAHYYDAWISVPERLCIEMLLDAEAALPQSKAVNYVSVIGGSGDSVTLRDEQTGELLSVRPDIVVNATGAWIDFTNQALASQSHLIGGTKGSHIIVDSPELYDATKGEMLFYENNDGRICLFFAYHGKVMIGTTDIPVDNPDSALCSEEEVDYLLNAVRLVFPAIHLDRSQIVYRFCGVRPLPSTDASTPGQISRDHSIETTPPDATRLFPVYSLVGGKWTTFRAFAEQAADIVLKELHRSRITTTENIPIGGGKGYPETDAEKAVWIDRLTQVGKLPREQANRLFDRYGTLAQEIVAYLNAGQDTPMVNLPSYTRREIQYLTERERVAHLDDLIIRRTLIAVIGQASRALLNELAETMAPVLGWSEDIVRQEVTRAENILRTRHGVTDGQLSAAGEPQPR